jgi:hypothetical protein
VNVIVIGIDPHMKSHAAVALDAVSGRSLGQASVTSDAAGCEALFAWARRLGDERLIAVEDCRHVSGRLERHLLLRGERLVRVPPKLMAKARSSAPAASPATVLSAKRRPLAVSRATAVWLFMCGSMPITITCASPLLGCNDASGDRRRTHLGEGLLARLLSGHVGNPSAPGGGGHKNHRSARKGDRCAWGHSAVGAEAT